MSNVRHRRVSAPPRAVRAEGGYIFDESGKRCFDGSGGAAIDAALVA